jgi:hypothetical protein
MRHKCCAVITRFAPKEIVLSLQNAASFSTFRHGKLPPKAKEPQTVTGWGVYWRSEPLFGLHCGSFRRE